MQGSKRSLRSIKDTGKIYFEKNWGAYLTGAIYPDDTILMKPVGV